MRGINFVTRNNQLKLIKCKCGLCDELIPNYDSRGRPIAYKKGHSRKKNFIFYNKPVKLRTSRERAKKILIDILKKNKCEVDNHICNGRLEPHHIDKNPFNNSLDNLLLLCDTHHNFADWRNLSLQELKEFDIGFYVDSHGNRRYKNNNVYS